MYQCIATLDIAQFQLLRIFDFIGHRTTSSLEASLLSESHQLLTPEASSQYNGHGFPINALRSS